MDLENEHIIASGEDEDEGSQRVWDAHVYPAIFKMDKDHT